MEALYHYLLSTRNRINTLIIDDAQNLNKRGQLELLRLVQNLETPQHKLLNLILFAQLEWMHILRAAPNFEQRVSTTYTLGPIGFDDTANLIQFRLRQAGAAERGPVFDDGAIRIIHAYADGSPRITVTLARNALLLAYQLRTRHVGQAIMLHTIQRTTMPDSDGRARVAGAIASLDRESSVKPAFDIVAPPVHTAKAASATPAPAPDPTPARRASNAQMQRANNMLLKAVRSHPDRPIA
jgi:hypothetical protein